MYGRLRNKSVRIKRKAPVASILLLSALGFFALGAVSGDRLLAGTIEDSVQEAIRLAAEGDGATSRLAMRNAAAELWLRTPLTIAKAVFVTKETPIYGAYDTRPDNVFAPGESVLVYAEPIGYGWRKEGDIYVTDLVVDAALLSPSGKHLWSKKAFGRFGLSSHYRFMAYMLNMELNVTGLPKGKYVLEYKVTDKILGHSATISLPFVER